MSERDERLRPVRSRPELGRDGVGAEPGRHDVHRAFAPQPVGDVEQPELGLEVQPVARLRLDRRDAVAEHLVEPAATVREQLALRGGAGRGDRRQDPAARRQDVEVRGAALAHDELVLAGPGEQQVRVRVDEARGDRPARRVDPGEPAEREALGLECRLDRRARPDGDDPSLPARDGRGFGPGRIVGPEAPDLALVGAAPDAALQRDDLGGTDDQEARGRLAGAAALDDAERAAHPARSRGPASARFLQPKLEGLRRREVAQREVGRGGPQSLFERRRRGPPRPDRRRRGTRPAGRAR